MNYSNPWAGLGQLLRPAPAAPAAARPRPDGSISRTEAMRRALRAHGPMTAAELAVHARVEDTSLVRALLKWDMSKHRVSFDGQRYAIGPEAGA